jgi:hypothetical protein
MLSAGVLLTKAEEEEEEEEVGGFQGTNRVRCEA